MVLPFDDGATMSTDREKGVALVMVLGIVALVAAWASTAAYEDMISLHRAENMQHVTRAWMAGESVLALAKFYLEEDAKDNTSDHLDEVWAMPVPPLPVDDGLISATLIDANRYLNLNDLVNQAGVAQESVVIISKRLFEKLEIPGVLVDKLVDWMDKDNIPRNSGAEDANYYDQTYRVKNARLDRIEELSLIDGFDAEIIQQLKAYVIIRPVPTGGLTKVNVNTVSKELLLAMYPKMLDADADALIEQRPFDQISDATIGQWITGANLNRLSVSSDAFIIRTHALFNRVSWREEYLVTRNNMQTRVIYRQRLGWEH